MSIIIQDTWCNDEDQELYEYFDNHNIVYKIKSGDDILCTNPYDIKLLFCDTAIFQKLLHSKLQIPNQYPQEFESLYKRKIYTTTLLTALKKPLPYFNIYYHKK